MNKITKAFVLYSIFSGYAVAEMDHSAMHHKMMAKRTIETQLNQAGNDVFATIQEVIKKLDNNPATDWSKVNIEALRQHLLDMNDMALHVEIISQKALKNGLEVTLQPTTNRAAQTLARVFNAHPMHLKRETGWDMQVAKNDKQFILTTTTEKPEQVQKIIALSYIGLMAYGNHHQPHHWGISTSQNPHGQH